MTRPLRRAVFNMLDQRAVWSPPAWVAERLRAALPVDWELIVLDEPVSGSGDGVGTASAVALAALSGAEIYFGLGLPRELLLAGLAPPRNLRWIHSGSAGVASLLHPELAEHDVVLTNSAGIHGAPMAETVIGMILHFARGLDIAVRAQQRADWAARLFERRDSGVREVAGTTLGIIGYGGIGREVAKRARALDMRVIGLRRTPGPAADAGILTGPDALGRLLEESDFVAITVPSTPATRGMIGARELARMRSDAVLINVARGNIIDEAALIDALRAGRLHGAALDVFTTEPLPPESPLWTLENVLVMPHTSPTTDRFWEREAELMLSNLRKYLAGEPLQNRVDLAAGY